MRLHGPKPNLIGFTATSTANTATLWDLKALLAVFKGNPTHTVLRINQPVDLLTQSATGPQNPPC